MHQVTREQLELLRQFGERGLKLARAQDVDEAEGVAFDASVEVLLGLERLGLVRPLQLRSNDQDRLSAHLVAFCTGLTPEGERTLRAYSEPMPPRTVELLVGVIGRRVRQRQQDTHRAWGEHFTGLVGSGMARSSRAMIVADRFIQGELQARSALVLQAVQEAADGAERPITDNMALDLLPTVCEAALAASDDLRTIHKESRRHLASDEQEAADWAGRCREFGDTLKAELLFATVAPRRSTIPQATGRGNTHIQVGGSVGSIQTGDNVSASVTQTIGVGPELVAHFEHLVELLGKVSDEREAERDALITLATAALTESRRPQPKLSILRSVWVGLTGGIQLLAELPEARDTIRAIAAHLGVPAPF